MSTGAATAVIIDAGLDMDETEMDETEEDFVNDCDHNEVTEFANFVDWPIDTGLEMDETEEDFVNDSDHTEVTEFANFVDWAIDAGLEMDETEELAFAPNLFAWRNWAKTARDPNQAQVASGEDFVYDSDTVFSAHRGERLTRGILKKAEIAEYKQGLRLRAEYDAKERAQAKEASASAIAV